MLTFDAVVAALRDAVPFVRTLGLEYVEASRQRAVVRLPDNPAHHNHVGGPHAGAMFTLAESASGAVVIAHFGELLDQVTPLAVRAEIRYLKVAMGPVIAEAVLGRPREEILEELQAGGRPEFPVLVTLGMPDGVRTGEMTILWTLRPQRSK